MMAGRNVTPHVAILLCLVSLASCERKTPPPKITELFKMSVRGDCKENHANKSGNYMGFIMLYRINSSGVQRVYGSVTAPIGDVEAIMESARHPEVYQPPMEITIDDAVPSDLRGTVILHGVSDSRTDEGEADKGYASTCNLTILDSEPIAPRT